MANASPRAGFGKYSEFLVTFEQLPVTIITNQYRVVRKKGGIITSDSSAREAAQRLFEVFGDEVFAHVSCMVGQPSDAEDVVQEIFLRVLRSWARFRHDASERTWVWSITRQCLREYYRSAKRRQYWVNGLEHESAAPASGIEDLVIFDVLRHLPPPQRQVVVLRLVQQQSSRETAELLGWSDAKVRVMLHRAVKTLREVLAHER